MAQDHGLCRKKGKESNGPVHGPPLQARVAAANGTVLQLANCWPCQTAETNDTSILAHMEMEQVASNNETK